MLTIESCVNIYDDDMVLVRTDGDFLVKAFYEDDDKMLEMLSEKLL